MLCAHQHKLKKGKNGYICHWLNFDRDWSKNKRISRNFSTTLNLELSQCLSSFHRNLLLHWTSLLIETYSFIEPCSLIETHSFIEPCSVIETHFFIEPCYLIETHFFIEPCSSIKTHFFIEPCSPKKFTSSLNLASS